MDYPETELVLDGTRVPIASFFSLDEGEGEGETRRLPDLLLRLMPLLERTCYLVDLDRELTADTTALLWKLLNERSQALRDTGKVEQTIATATTRQEFIEVIVECLRHGLTPRCAEPASIFSVERLRRLLKPSLQSRARRLLGGRTAAGLCSDYADLFQLLFLIAKRCRGFEDLAAVSVAGRWHRWNWVVSTHDGWIAPFDVHTAAVAEALPSVGSIWNTELEGPRLPHVSGFASTVMTGFAVHPAMADRPEVVEFFDGLFASAGEQRRALAYQIAQHGMLHPEVEKRVVELWPAGQDQQQRRAGLARRGEPLRRLFSAERQLRLLAKVFDA